MIGKAFLVGAGPGNPELITVKGLRLIQKADVLIYDRLIPAELLHEAPEQAERVFAGKVPGRHLLSQGEINALIVQRVKEGKCVVRLKGGDPFVFGRGGEEALALAEAGLPFEVVPGITSAIVGPAYAGIPVTHRNISTGFAVITGHTATSGTDRVCWKAYAHMPTLVIMMGLHHLPSIIDIFIGEGRDPDTPAASISHATTSHQKTIYSTLASLAKDVQQANLQNPAVSIIGETVRLASQLGEQLSDIETLSFIPLHQNDIKLSLDEPG